MNESARWRRVGGGAAMLKESISGKIKIMHKKIKDERGDGALWELRSSQVGLHCQGFWFNWSWIEPGLGYVLKASQVTLMCSQEWKPLDQNMGWKGGSGEVSLEMWAWPDHAGSGRPCQGAWVFFSEHWEAILTFKQGNEWHVQTCRLQNILCGIRIRRGARIEVRKPVGRLLW